jgi:hypothetical protein
LFSILIACEGQSLAQSPQPMQPREQTSRTAFPFSCELHATNTRAVLGMRIISPLGQAFSHAPQESQMAVFTLAQSYFIFIALVGQAVAQFPCPRQPAEQAFPPKRI